MYCKILKAPFEILVRILKTILLRKTQRSIGFHSSLTRKDLIPILKGIVFVRTRQWGPSIREYEEKFANFIGVPYAFSFYAGRVALDAILYALDIKPRDEIILPGYTCVAVPNPILFRKAIPVYVDIDPSTCNISPQAVCQAITKRTKAIIVQHTYGIPADMDAFMKISQEYNIPIIEDCTHALGNNYKGKKLGTFGHAAFFSSEQSKIICTGMGGIAITKDSQLADKIREYQDFCIMPTSKEIRKALYYLLFKLIFLNPSTEWLGKILGYYFEKLGLISFPSTTNDELNCKEPPNFRKRFPNALARVGISQLNQIEWNLKKRKKIVEFYHKKLPEIGLQRLNLDHQQPMVRYPFLSRNKYKLRNFAQKFNIDIGIWFCAPIHPHEVPQELAGYRYGSCPNAETAVISVANLPCHPNLKIADLEKIIAVLKEFKKHE